MSHALTDLLLAHRAAGTTIADLAAELVPQTKAEAYEIQTQSVAALGAVGGWKVQPLPESGEPFAAPILQRTVFADGAQLSKSDFAGLGIEVEVAVTIGTDLPGKQGGYTAEDMRRALASVHVALEILSSRFADRSKVPQLAGIADLQSGGAVVLGTGVQFDSLPEFGNQAMSLRFGDELIKTTEGNASTQNLLGSLAWLANHTVARGLPLKAGNVVITGSRIGPLPFDGKVVSAHAPRLGDVTVRFS